MTDSPQKPPTDSYSTTLREVECFELLAVEVVGRIGFVSSAGIQILPVNYRLGAGHRLFFKTAPRGALAQLAETEAQVAFEVDYHAADFQIAWSVLMNGTIQQGFMIEHGLQCGFCTPGMMLTANWLLDANPHPTDSEIREAISGNLCRCTGYENIVRAVRWAAEHPQDPTTAAETEEVAAS